MNILENYIQEIIYEKPSEKPWIKEDWAKDKNWIDVKLVVNCYGNIQTYERTYEERHWQQIRNQGYFMG